MKFLVLLALSNLISFSFTETKVETVDKAETLKERVTSENTIWLSYPHSPVDLFQLSSFEEDLFTTVKNYVTKLENQSEYSFKRYIADYESSSTVAFNGWNKTSVNEKHFLIHSNPLLSYRMIWRFVTDIPRIKDILFSSGDSEILDKLQDTTDPYFVWPTEKDLNSAMDSLLILHDVYNLNISEFANGIIENIVTNASLSAIHCFEISQFALRNNKQYTLAFEWLRIANIKRENLSGHPILDHLEKREVSKLLKDIAKQHDTFWKKRRPNHFNLHQYVNKIDSQYHLLPQRTVLSREYKSKGDADLTLSLNDITAFTTLCKGGNLQSEKEKSELHCWYESKLNPAWYINPQKMELHSKDPYIWQVYDFIGDDLIKYLKMQAIPIMERSEATTIIYNDSDTEQKTKELKAPFQVRTSLTSWLDENKREPILSLSALSQKIGYITGLSPSWGIRNPTNYLQIAVYATGGYFHLHLDTRPPSTDSNDLIDKNSIGDRLATFMLYLNNVDLGGNTVFTSVGVAVPPVKGSALFWYNLKHSGETDYRVWHAGCPVLLGEKWVGNKWIHNNLNIFQRKCTLNKDE